MQGLYIICKPRQRFRQRHSFEVIQGLCIICQPRHAQKLVRLHVVPVLILSYFGMLLGQICLIGATEGKWQSHVHAADNPGKENILRLMQANLTKGGPKLIALLLL